jgi:hypothetical protein
MARVVRDPEFQPNDGGNSSARPDLSPEAVRFGATLPQHRQLGELPGRQSARGSRGRAMAQGLRAALASACHPLADGPFADTQGRGDLALRPALLLEVPGLEPSGFFPVVRYGFHAWQCITAPAGL